MAQKDLSIREEPVLCTEVVLTIVLVKVLARVVAVVCI